MSYARDKGYILKPKPGVMVDWGRPLSQGLVALFLFNEGGGSRLYDISNNNNHGTLTNMDANDWVGSPRGGGLDFDGSNDVIEISNSSELNPIHITLEAIFSRRQTSFREVLIAKQQAGHPYGYTIYINDTDEPYFSLAIGDTYFQYKSTETITDTKQHHMIATYDGLRAKLYVDGLLKVDSGSLIGSLLSITETLKIGLSDAVPANYFQGQIDKITIYNRALSAYEVKQLYQDPYANLLRVPYRRWFEFIPEIVTGTWQSPPTYLKSGWEKFPDWQEGTFDNTRESSDVVILDI